LDQQNFFTGEWPHSSCRGQRPRRGSAQPLSSHAQFFSVSHGIYRSGGRYRASWKPESSSWMPIKTPSWTMAPLRDRRCPSSSSFSRRRSAHGVFGD
jgi:hypothetical protein